MKSKFNRVSSPVSIFAAVAIALLIFNCGGGGSGGSGGGGGGGSLPATRVPGDYSGVGDVVTDGTWLAWIAADKEIVVYTIAVGDPTAAGEEQLDEEALRNLAQTTGGRYFHADDREQLEGIYTELDRLEARQVETISHRPRVDLFHWPISFALVLSLGYYLVVVIHSKVVGDK